MKFNIKNINYCCDNHFVDVYPEMFIRLTPCDSDFLKFKADLRFLKDDQDWHGTPADVDWSKSLPLHELLELVFKTCVHDRIIGYRFYGYEEIRRIKPVK